MTPETLLPPSSSGERRRAAQEARGPARAWDPNGPTARVQRGTIRGAESEAVGEGVEADDPPASGAPGVGDPNAPADAGAIIRWGVSEAANLPVARADAMGYATNGAMYVIGGADGSGTQNEVYWTVPVPGRDGDDIPEWLHLGQSDLPEPGLARAAVGQVGPNLLLVGGTSGENLQTGSVRTNLSPQEPFFRVGLVGMTVPALKIDGEIGQQLGYLNAAGAGTVMFVLLLIVGWMFAHKEQTRSWWRRVRRR